MNTLKVARVAFNGTPRSKKEILLYGPRLRSFSSWMEQVKRFYDNILGDSELLNGMKEYGYTEQKLRQEAALMAEVYAKHLQQAKETGEAQEATKIRDKALDELAVYVSNLRAIVKVALSDSPQQLEKLGILARAGGAAPRKPVNPTEISASLYETGLETVTIEEIYFQHNLLLLTQYFFATNFRFNSSQARLESVFF